MLRMTVASAKARKSPSLAPIKSILLRVFDLKDMTATLVSYRKQATVAFFSPRALCV